MQIPARLHTFFFAVIFSVLFTLIPSTVFASHEIDPLQKQNTNADVPANQHTMAQTLLIEVSTALICQMTGIDMTNPQQSCLGIDPHTKKIGYAPEQTDPQLGGAMGQMVGLISATYNIPVSTVDYTSHLAENFGVTKKVYAQGQGFDNLRPILNLWTRIRNITYLAFVVIFVLIGLGIMLRVKIDPRTTMNIQNQIPKIIVTLLLITFSYPIAGAFIDTMWMATYVGINVITDPSVTACPAIGTAATTTLLENPIAFLHALLGNSACGRAWGVGELSLNVGSTVGDIVSNVILSVLGLSTDTAGCSAWNPDSWGRCASRIIYSFFASIITLLGFIVVLGAIYLSLFRVWFSLIKAYVTFIFYTMLGPLWIFLGLIPGAQSFGFGQWLRRILAPLMVFPMTVFLFVMAAVVVNDPVLSNFDAARPNDGVFLPPLVSNPSLSDNLGYIFALGVILLAPEAIAMTRAAFKAPDSTYLPKIMAGLGAGAGAAAPLGKYFFGKGKDGVWGPGSYYGTRALRGAVGRIPGVNEGAKRAKKWIDGLQWTKDREDARQRVYNNRQP